MITEEEIANIVRLFAHLGDTMAISFLFDEAKNAIEENVRSDVVPHLLNLSEKFFSLKAEANDKEIEDIDRLRIIGVSLRIVAHRLHRMFAEKADDPRLLRLVSG